MPNTTVYTNNQYYQDIAAAIREKNGQSTLYKPSEMAPAINALIVSGETFSLQAKTVNPTTLTQTVFADTGYNALSQVTVNAIQTETKTVSQNGTVRPTEGKYLTLVNVAVTASDISLEDKIVTPTESEQTVTAGIGYQGLGTVTIAAVPNDYIGSGITRRVENDLTTSGAYVSAPAGYYSSTVSKSVATTTQATPTISVNASGLISATVTQGTGYVTAGTKTATEQLLTQTGTTIIPSATSQTAVTSGKYTTGTITVASVPSETATLTTNGTHTPTSGKWFSSVTVSIPSDINNQNKTVTPTESEQEITPDAGYSGLGTVTVKAIDSNYVGSGVPAKSSVDLTISGDTITAPAGYYNSPATLTMTHKDLGMPTISINSSTGVITSTAEIASGKNGYYGVQNASRTLSLTVQTGTTITPSTASQTAVAKNVYTLGTVTVAPVPTETATLTSNGTHNATSGKFWSSVTVAVPSDINNQNKTVTSSTTTQTISADNGYSGLGTVTINAIATATQATPTITVSADGKITATATQAAGYVTAGTKTATSQLNIQSATTITPKSTSQTAVASGKYTTGAVTVAAVPTDTSNTFSANGTYTPTSGKWFDSVTVSVPSDINNQEKTISSSTATQTVTPDSAYSGLSKVTVNAMPVSTITNGVLNVETITEATNDYGVRASITIPAGYYNATTLSKVLSTVLPAPASAITQSQMLSGYEAYNNEGQLLAGTMTNRNDWGATLDQTTTSVTIPEGYHNGSGVVSHTTVNIPDPTISLVNSTGVITASGTWTRGFTTDNSYTKTYTLTTQTGTTITPSETAQTAVASYRWTTGTITVGAIPSDYVGSGITTRTSLAVNANTVTASAGYYPNAITTTIAAMTLPTSAVTTSAGTAKATITRSTATRYINIPVGYNSTAAHYVISAVANGTVVPPTTITGSQATVTAGTNVLTFSKSISVTPNVTTAGYISAGTASNVTVTLFAAITTKAAATITPGTATTTIAAGTYLTGAQTVAGDADLVAGNIKTGVNIFGTNGTFTADATATASDILDGETAYVNGVQVTGTLSVNYFYTGSSAPAANLGNNGDIYLQE